MRSTISKLSISLGIAAFLIIGFWGLLSMHANEQGEMMHCPLMASSETMCPMNIAEHIMSWQQTFTLTKEGKSLLFSLAILLALLAASTLSFFRHCRADKPVLLKYRLYLIRHRPDIKLFNYFLVAFSRGILHSRIYA